MTGGRSIQRWQRIRGGDLAAARLWRKTLCPFSLLLYSGVVKSQCLWVHFFLSFFFSDPREGWRDGVREEPGGDWERDGEARGNRCSALLGWAHTGEGDRERIPHFSSAVLQQCRDMAARYSQQCAIDLSGGNPILTHSLPNCCFKLLPVVVLMFLVPCYLIT